MIKCLVCGKKFEPSQSPAMPFCSDRCRLIDLGRWLKEENRLPAFRSGLEDEESPELEDDASPDPEDDESA